MQKQVYNKDVKPRSYTPSDKVWLNSKYINTKQNRKLEAKFFELFYILHPIGKQAYKLELSKKWRIYDVFHMSLLEQNITRKEQVDKNVTNQNLKPTRVKSTKWRPFEIVRSMQKSRKVIYQDFIFWFYKRVTLRKKILGNPH